MRTAAILIFFFVTLLVAVGLVVANTQPLEVAFLTPELVLGRLPLWAWLFLSLLVGFVAGSLWVWLNAWPKRRELSRLRRARAKEARAVSSGAKSVQLLDSA